MVLHKNVSPDFRSAILTKCICESWAMGKYGGEGQNDSAQGAFWKRDFMTGTTIFNEYALKEMNTVVLTSSMAGVPVSCNNHQSTSGLQFDLFLPLDCTLVCYHMHNCKISYFNTFWTVNEYVD